MDEYNDLIFEISRPGRVGYSLPKSDVESIDLEAKFPKHLIRDEEAELPEVAELDIMRHYTALSNKNHGIDTGFYPLGSCTMKYNPKVNEVLHVFQDLAVFIHINQRKRYKVH